MSSSIVASVGQQLGTLLVEEAISLRDVSGKIEDLKKELVWMQGFLADADNKEHKEKRVSLCVAEIRDFAYAVEVLVERYIHDVSNPPPKSKGLLDTLKWFSCSCGDVKALHNIGSSIDEFIAEFKMMTSRLQTYGIHNNPQPESSTCVVDNMWEQRRTYSHIEETTIGLDNHIQVVVDKLVNEDGVPVVGICGIGGLGKTTLVRKVYSHKKVKARFKNCVWVYISKQFERRNVFEVILKELSCSMKDEDNTRMKIKELTNDELARKICEVLEKEECLVVVDDIWSKNAWNTLNPAFGSIKRSRSKILITTQNLELVQHADRSRYTHPFGTLGVEDSWKLLQQAAYLEENNKIVDEEKAKMENLGKEIVKHCKGLPLAIVALGGILSTKKIFHEWENVGKNISLYLSDNARQGEGASETVLHVLELSYSDLPYYLKPCFMYLGIFPEDYEINAHQLFHLWEAEGLVTLLADEKEKSVGVRVDDIAESYLNQLVNKSMVQVETRWPNGSIQSCRLHDVMRDMCLSKCREAKFVKIDERRKSEELSNDKDTKTSHRWAIYMTYAEMNGDNPIFKAEDLERDPYVRSLIGLSYNRILYGKIVLSLSMRKMLSVVRVLHLDGVKASGGASVLRHFIHLRYLRTTGWSDDKFDHVVDYIWSCKYLETLDFSGCKMKLSNELWKLGRLRHLYLPYEFELQGSNKLRLTITQLGQMETIFNFDKNCQEMEDLRKMTNLMTLKLKYERNFEDKNELVHLMEMPAVTSGRLKSPFILNINANVLNEDPTILTSSSLKMISINVLLIRGSIMETYATHKFPRSLIELHLMDGELGKEDMLEVENLPHLEYLSLQQVKCSKMSFSAGSFKKLLKLHLVDVCVEEWEVGEGSLPNLRHLLLKGCSNLKRIPEGLPPSINIKCIEPDYIEGCDNYHYTKNLNYRSIFGWSRLSEAN